MLLVVTYLWGDKYGVEDVVKLRSALSRNIRQPYEFLVIADPTREYALDNRLGRHALIPPADLPLTWERGCFARLRLFHREWRNVNLGASFERVLVTDLDNVVTGELDSLVNRPENFVILGSANAANPCPYNGSLWMFRTDAPQLDELWSKFCLLEDLSQIPYYEFPDDQGWFHLMLPNAATWQAGPRSGVYGFQKPGWPEGDDLPTDARMVAFFGWRSPEKFKHLPWVQEHWR